MERALNRIWYGGASTSILLLPLAWLYGAVMAVRRVFYEQGWLSSYRITRPVIVVGNLTVGGTGKTPFVAWLAERLTERGLRVGILSRGYGSNSTSPRVVEPNSPWSQVGDEPLLLRQRTGCDVVVSVDRAAGAQLLVQRGADVVVSDDGLQHLRLARDFEIVVVDGARGFGNGRLLPAGPLREPSSRAGLANLVVINGRPEHASLTRLPGSPDAQPVQMTLAGARVLPVAGTRAERTLESFRGQRVHAVAGIGNPWRFFADLRGRGLDVVEHAFPDHHPFTAPDLDFGDSQPVLMTEKDAVKCRAFADARAWYVPVAARFSDAQSADLLEKITGKLGRRVDAVVR
ncbi:MAG: tetraacyldisaccharide 4'-kinase [Gammaproteobacteria bacterium]